MKHYLAGIVIVGCFGMIDEVMAVTINEVAWMGTSNSPNHEWIELYNPGDTVSLDGWTLTDAGSLSISLSGTLPAQGYAVLERTSDESAPATAFLIYTGALVNTGTTLTLRRDDGSVVDQVVGGENWQSIGGNNETKETAQRTASGWVTGVATPGVANVTAGSAPSANLDTNNEASATAVKTSGGSGVIRRATKSETVRLMLADVSLALAVEAPGVGYVNQTITFKAQPSGLGEVITNSLTYEWNFGDGSTSSQKEVSHAYRYPGTYAVTLYATYGRHEQVAQFEITILPVSLTLATTASGDIQIHNNAVYDIDISGYRLQGASSFVFPPRSVILAKQTITLPRERVGVSVAALYDDKRSQVASLINESTNVDRVAIASLPTALASLSQEPSRPVSQRSAVSPDAPFTFAPVLAEAPLTATTTVVAATTTSILSEEVPQLVSAAGAANGDLLRVYGPYVGLLVLVLLAVFGLLTTKRREVSEG